MLVEPSIKCAIRDADRWLKFIIGMSLRRHPSKMRQIKELRYRIVLTSRSAGKMLRALRGSTRACMLAPGFTEAAKRIKYCSSRDPSGLE